MEADVTCGTVRSHPALLPSPLPRLRTRAMLTDLTLASLHHLLVFGLVSMLVAQAVLLRGRLDGAVLAKLGGIDRGYGITALSLLVVGFLRVFHGVMGEARKSVAKGKSVSVSVDSGGWR